MLELDPQFQQQAFPLFPLFAEHPIHADHQKLHRGVDFLQLDDPALGDLEKEVIEEEALAENDSAPFQKSRRFEDHYKLLGQSVDLEKLLAQQQDVQILLHQTLLLNHLHYLLCYVLNLFHFGQNFAF